MRDDDELDEDDFDVEDNLEDDFDGAELEDGEDLEDDDDDWDDEGTGGGRRVDHHEEDEFAEDYEPEEDNKEPGDFEANSDDDYEDLLDDESDSDLEEAAHEEMYLTDGEVAQFLSVHQTYQPEAPNPASKYQNVCWGEHKAHLSDKTHRRCQGCGWLICRCGKCWCSMPLLRKALYKVHVRYILAAVKCPVCRAHPVEYRKQCSGGRSIPLGRCGACREGVTFCSACAGKGFTRAVEESPF